jgi:hypothetical protein
MTTGRALFIDNSGDTTGRALFVDKSADTTQGYQVAWAEKSQTHDKM